MAGRLSSSHSHEREWTALVVSHFQAVVLLVPDGTSYSCKGKEVAGQMERILLEMWMVESVLITGHKV